MRTLDRVLAFVCAVTAVFALSFALGRVAGPLGQGDHGDDRSRPAMEHGGGDDH
jgi:hypothetical protein